MKSVAFSILLIISLIPFYSCEKEEIDPADIQGDWIWEKSVGGWVTLTPNNIHEERSLQIDKEYYREFVNGSLVYESPYQLVIRPDSMYGDQRFIVFPSGYEEAVGFSKLKLVRLESMWIDGFTHYYHRRKVVTIR